MPPAAFAPSTARTAPVLIAPPVRDKSPGPPRVLSPFAAPHAMPAPLFAAPHAMPAPLLAHPPKSFRRGPLVNQRVNPVIAAISGCFALHLNAFTKTSNTFFKCFKGVNKTNNPAAIIFQFFTNQLSLFPFFMDFHIPFRVFPSAAWCFSRSFCLFSAQASSSIFSSADKLLWPKNASAVVLVFFSMAVNLSNIPSDPSLPIVSKISSLGSALVAPSGTLGSEKGTILFESNVA